MSYTARVTTKTTKAERKRNKICENKIIPIASIRDQGEMSLLWMRVATWKMGELVVYWPGVEAFARLDEWEAPDELCELLCVPI